MNEIIQKHLEYKKYVVDSKLRYFKPHAGKIEKTFAEEISSSLVGNSKFISPKFFTIKKGQIYLKKYVLCQSIILPELKLVF